MLHPLPVRSENKQKWHLKFILLTENGNVVIQERKKNVLIIGEHKEETGRKEKEGKKLQHHQPPTYGNNKQNQ